MVGGGWIPFKLFFSYLFIMKGCNLCSIFFSSNLIQNFKEWEERKVVGCEKGMREKVVGCVL